MYWEDPVNQTRLLDSTGLKFAPVRVTTVPAPPLVGVKLVIVGSGTVKSVLEQPSFVPTSTQICPVATSLGTVTVSCVVDAELIVATRTRPMPNPSL